jgi:hypothetical protein
MSPSAGQLVKRELPQRVVNRGLRLLDPVHGVRRNHEQVVDAAQFGHRPTVVTRQADGEQATPARLVEGAYEIGGVARRGQPDDDVTAPPECRDLTGEDDFE